MSVQNNHLVFKSNSLIEGRYSLSVAEQRIVLMLAAAVKPSDIDLHPYRFTVQEMGRLCGVKADGRSYAEAHAVIMRLLTRVITIPEEGGGWFKTQWLGGARYHPGDGAFSLSFHPELKPHLLALHERFTAYQLGNIMHLRSKYSIRIYELLKQYEGIGARSFGIDELRGLLGVRESEYLRADNFRDRVLNPAKRELPKKTDIKFTYKKIVRARRIIGYKFKISASKTEPATPDFTPTPQTSLPFPSIDLRSDNEPVPQTESILQARKIRQSLAEQLKTP